MAAQALDWSGPLLAQNDWGHMDLDDGWGAVMLIGMIMFWVLLAVGVGWLVRELIGSRAERGAGSRRSDPIEVLDHRLASGDISAEEYRERRQLLEGWKAPHA